jgi:hypothetical protein
MKYFTPELIAQGQSTDDKVVTQAEEAWDQVSDRYFAYLDSIKASMPPGLRRRVDEYYLHDAVIQAMSLQGGKFVIVLQLDPPPQSLLTLTYDLVEEPVILRQAPAAGNCSVATVEWQYDEIELSDGTPAVWEQSILLSNGWEVKLHFRDVVVQEAQAILPVPREPLPAIRSA